MNRDTAWVAALLLLVLLHEKGTSFGFSSIGVPPHLDRTAAERRLTNLCAASNETPQPQQRETVSSLSAQLTDHIVLEGTNDDTRRAALVCTRLEGLHLERTRLGPSTIVGAGRGLFAACDSNEGDLLTCYPGDALVTLRDDNGSINGVSYDVIWSPHVDPSQRTLQAQWQGYLLQACGDYGVLGLPSLNHDPAYLGHFVNDGSRLVSQGGFTDYVLESFDKANAQHADVDRSHLVLVAARDLVQGEEIFVTYGPDYWMEQPGFVDDGSSLDGEDED